MFVFLFGEGIAPSPCTDVLFAIPIASPPPTIHTTNPTTSTSPHNRWPPVPYNYASY